MDQKLLALLAKRTPIKKIAEQLGKTAKSIRRRCDRIKVSSATVYAKKGEEDPGVSTRGSTLTEKKV
jgi:DNA-binding Lrp family transcriptional regulator